MLMKLCSFCARHLCHGNHVLLVPPITKHLPTPLKSHVIATNWEWNVIGMLYTWRMAAANPAKTNLQDHARLCKNLARILHARLAWHVHAICPFSCTILTQSCTILTQSCTNSCKILQKSARNSNFILAASLAKSCTISCKICARLCKNRARKGTYRVHVPSKSCMQDSCTILHDLASSFLLGTLLHLFSRYSDGG